MTVWGTTTVCVLAAAHEAASLLAQTAKVYSPASRNLRGGVWMVSGGARAGASEDARARAPHMSWPTGSQCARSAKGTAMEACAAPPGPAGTATLAKPASMRWKRE